MQEGPITLERLSQLLANIPYGEGQAQSGAIAALAARVSIEARITILKKAQELANEVMPVVRCAALGAAHQRAILDTQPIGTPLDNAAFNLGEYQTILAMHDPIPQRKMAQEIIASPASLTGDAKFLSAQFARLENVLSSFGRDSKSYLLARTLIKFESSRFAFCINPAHVHHVQNQGGCIVTAGTLADLPVESIYHELTNTPDAFIVDQTPDKKRLKYLLTGAILAYDRDDAPNALLGAKVASAHLDLFTRDGKNGTIKASAYGEDENLEKRQSEARRCYTELSKRLGTTAADFHAALDQFAVEQRMSVARR